jgi:protein SCO1
MNKIILLGLISCLFVMSCNLGGKEENLENGFLIETPEYDEKAPLPVIKDTLPAFSFTNQDGKTITNETFTNKIYITDFFFTRCPTQCPAMKAQMLRIYEKYKDNDNVILLSHSIDPRNDTIETLKKYSDKLQVNAEKWHFVTGKKSDIRKMAQAYYIPYEEDANEPGGYLHSKRFMLIDGQGKLRGSCSDGTLADATTIFMKDIDKLLDEAKK